MCDTIMLKNVKFYSKICIHIFFIRKKLKIVIYITHTFTPVLSKNYNKQSVIS